MKNKKLIVSFSLCTLFFLLFSFYNTAFTKEDGAPSGKTGSPGDEFETCAQVDCHTGTAKPKDGLISTTIPETGYLASETYQITVTIDFPGRSTFGFQASPQNLEGDKMGDIILTDEVQMKTTGVKKYVTHEKAGITGSDGKSWTFDWTPDDASGDVTFYVAVNAADGDEEATGDSIYYGSITVIEDPTNILPIENLPFETYKVVNPFEETLAVYSDKNYSLELFDIHGALIYSQKDIQGNILVDASQFAKGIYFLKIKDGRQYYLSRLVKS